MTRAFFLAALVASSSAFSILRTGTQDLCTIETAPGVTKVVTEADKWKLKAQGIRFFDITSYPELQEYALQTDSEASLAVTYPTAVQQTTAVKALLPSLDKGKINSTLTTFSGFYNRYYKSTYGKQSSDWLLEQIKAIITASGAKTTSAKAFPHTWTQSSIIATITGASNKTIVIGAHQDSINQQNPTSGKAPGADDDGSGSMTILEAFRVILSDAKVAAGQAPNTIEFHWYSAEEGGLLGSQAIFTDYKNRKIDVKAMLQQDMTGYVKSGTTESVGVITDYVDASLTAFIKKVITAYCDIPFVETKCGYACSDHASASKAGYPSAFVIESTFENSLQVIHTAQDTIEKVNFNHVLQHAKMTLGLAYELAFASF